jgi:hypothetical protein
MDQIVKLKPQQFKTIEGVFSGVTERAKAKKQLTSILAANEIVGSLVSDEGDIQEGTTKLSLKDAHAVILYVDEDYFKVLTAGKSEDEEGEEVFFHLCSGIEHNGWILGKGHKKLNGIKVDSDEVIAVRASDCERVPMTASF